MSTQLHSVNGVEEREREMWKAWRIGGAKWNKGKLRNQEENRRPSNCRISGAGRDLTQVSWDWTGQLAKSRLAWWIDRGQSSVNFEPESLSRAHRYKWRRPHVKGIARSNGKRECTGCSSSVYQILMVLPELFRYNTIWKTWLPLISRNYSRSFSLRRSIEIWMIRRTSNPQFVKQRSDYMWLL